MSVLLRAFWKTFLVMGILSFILAITSVVYLENNLPPVETLRDVQLQVPLKIYSADGKLIAEYGEKRRTPLSLEQIPSHLIHAILATEDHRFYQHPGVDMRGLARAAHTLISKGTKEQGGSTITMQVARNFFLTRKKTYIRKVNEILLALKIEQELSKDEILELYLNKIYLGKRAYGVAAAAEVYYGTTIDQLSIAQMAMIAGLPQAPSAINPLNSPVLALKRRNHVLDRMLNYQLITQEEFDLANQETIITKYHGRPIELEAPYIAEMVRQQLVEQYGETVYDTGYEIKTTIHSNLQEAANLSIFNTLLDYDKRHGFRKPKNLIQEAKLGHSEINDYLAQMLLDYPRINALEPAAVIRVEPENIHVLLKTGEQVKLPWAAFSWAIPRQQTNHMNATHLVTRGDLIYLQQQNSGKSWGLSQPPEVEGALVAIHPDNGAILSLVGGFDYEQSRFNRATQAERQPGSSFKPFIYGAALEHGYTAASIINDAPIVESAPTANSDWRPQNHTRNFYGPTRLRIGMTHSRNLVSIRLLRDLGIDKALDFINNVGLERDSLPKSLSLALGTNHLSPLELAKAYSVFANGGSRVQPYLIQSITDYHNHVIFEANPEIVIPAGIIAAEEESCTYKPAPQVIMPQTAYLMTSLLQDVIHSGTGQMAKKLGRSDIAGKTGTTNDQMDAWYAGYNRDIVATAWVGFDEPRSLKEYAVKAALPMWVSFMEKALATQPEHTLPQPSGLTTVRIDPTTGLLARPGQHDAIYETFTDDTVPTQTAPDTENASVTGELLETQSLF